MDGKWQGRPQHGWLWNFERRRGNDHGMMQVVSKNFLCGSKWCDLINGDSFYLSFHWNIFLKSLCDSWNHLCMQFDHLWTCKRLEFSCKKFVRSLTKKINCRKTRAWKIKCKIKWNAFLYLKEVTHLKKSSLSKPVFMCFTKTS